MKPSLVIIGLGNPGKSHERTRHNIGFQATDILAQSYGTEAVWRDQQKFIAETIEARILTIPILLVRPKTFMNRSGESAKKIVDFFKLDTSSQIIIICDDIDLAVGEMRFRKSGSAGTHNGLRSIVETLGEKVPRIRIGIGSPSPGNSVDASGGDLSSYVLSRPPAEEENVLHSVLAKLPEMIRKCALDRNEPS